MPSVRIGILREFSGMVSAVDLAAGFGRWFWLVWFNPAHADTRKVGTVVLGCLLFSTNYALANAMTLCGGTFVVMLFVCTLSAELCRKTLPGPAQRPSPALPASKPSQAASA